MAPAADRAGYWGAPTSTLEWCEENYAVSYYIAEFWNTVSNLIFILPPIYGAIQTYKDGLEKRYLAAFFCLTAVGLGSWCFHMTLKYEMQLLDELPMIYSCCVFVYCLYECFKHKNSVNYPLLFVLITFSVIVSIVSNFFLCRTFICIVYGALVSIIVLRSVYIVLWVYPWLRGLGYTSLNNIFCDKLRGLREKMPPVVGAVTQFHAWWHIFTGLGSYLHILLSLYTRTLFLKYRPKVKVSCQSFCTY
uniref:Alkaline ceramidase n=1 Tax=Chrysemys picta bellii TaxID=8478 RepID=A0A8C3IXP7_CHRPI